MFDFTKALADVSVELLKIAEKIEEDVTKPSPKVRVLVMPPAGSKHYLAIEAVAHALDIGLTIMDATLDPEQVEFMEAHEDLSNTDEQIDPEQVEFMEAHEEKEMLPPTWSEFTKATLPGSSDLFHPNADDTKPKRPYVKSGKYSKKTTYKSRRMS